MALTKDQVILLKRHRHHANRTHILLRNEAMIVHGVEAMNVKDAPKKILIRFLDHFNNARPEYKDYTACFISNGNGNLMGVSAMRCSNLYAAKEEAKQLQKKLKYTNCKIRVRENKRP